jgi:cellobiose-specific phosphotransferase system component IIB
MDADLKKFLAALNENTKAQKKLQEAMEKHSIKLETIIEMTKTMLRGDKSLKLKPLVIMVAELNHLLTLIGPDIRYIAQRIGSITKVPKLVEMFGEIFKGRK